MSLGHSGDVADRDLQRHSISVTGDDAGGQGLLLVIADEHPVSGLRIERQVIGTRAVRDPAGHREVTVDGGGVVPEVVGGAHGLDATTYVDRVQAGLSIGPSNRVRTRAN